MKNKDELAKKLLTISARDYCEMQGKNLSDYTAEGVVCEGNLATFVSWVRDEAEAVVEFRIEKGKDICIENMYYYGTALVPKER